MDRCQMNPLPERTENYTKLRSLMCVTVLWPPTSGDDIWSLGLVHHNLQKTLLHCLLGGLEAAMGDFKDHYLQPMLHFTLLHYLL